MKLETIFALLLFANFLYGLATKAANDTRNWKEKLRFYAPFVIGALVFYSFHGVIITLIQNAVTRIGNSGGAEVKMFLAVGLIAGIVIFGIAFFNNVFVSQEKNWQKPLWWITGINIGMLIFVIYMKTNSVLAFAPKMFIVFNGFVLLIAAVYFWKSKLQNLIATPIAFHAAIALTIFFWYCRTGINYFPNWKNLTFENTSYWLIFYAVTALLNIIYDKGKEWYRRWSYRVVSTYLVLMLIVSLGLGFVNFFGSHAEERQAKAKLNFLQMTYLQKQLEGIGSQKVAGVTAEMVDEIMKNPTAKPLEDIEKALARQKKIAEQMETVVASDPGAKPLYNESIVGKWKESPWYPPNWFQDKEASASTGENHCWKTVYKKTFVGVGYTGGDDPKYNDGGIWTAKHEKDMKIGDRYTVIDSDFEVWDANSWKKCQKYQWLSVKGIQPGNNATFRNEKGKKFTVIVERYM